MDEKDAEVVIVLAAVLHDLGHAVHRVHHEEFGIGIAESLIPDILKGVYEGNDLGIIEGEFFMPVMLTKRKWRPSPSRPGR